MSNKGVYRTASATPGLLITRNGLYLLVYYILCYMELREGDVDKNLNIRSSRGAAEYSSTFEMVLPGGLLKFCFSNSPAGRPTAASSGSRIDRPSSACQLDSAAQQESLKNKTVLGHPAGPFQKSNCTRPPRGRTVYFDFCPRPPPSVPYSIILTPVST